MKLTRQPDGTTVLEGTPDEVRELLAPPKDAIGKMLVQYPPAAGCAPMFAGQVWVGEIRPQPLSFLPSNAAACVPWGGSFVWHQ